MKTIKTTVRKTIDLDINIEIPEETFYFKSEEGMFYQISRDRESDLYPFSYKEVRNDRFGVRLFKAILSEAELGTLMSTSTIVTSSDFNNAINTASNLLLNEMAL